MILSKLVFGLFKNEKQNSSKQRHVNRGFAHAVKNGYKVYDAYYQSYRWGYDNQLTLDHYMKLSILSKSPLRKVDFRRLYPGIMGDYLGVVYNPKANYCKYITLNGKSIDRFSNKTGKHYPIKLNDVCGTEVNKFYITEY